MSGRGRGKYWTASVLKRRGWTNELIRALLPKPRYILSGEQSIRVWDKEEVRAAENGPGFSRRESAAPSGTSRPSGPEVRRTRAALAQAWDGAEKDETLPWLLAGQYHRAILSRLSAGGRGRGLRGAPPPRGASLCRGGGPRPRRRPGARGEGGGGRWGRTPQTVGCRKTISFSGGPPGGCIFN